MVISNHLYVNATEKITMPRKGYVHTEEHNRKAIEGIRKFYASPQSQKTRKKIARKVREYYQTHPKHNSPETRKRISIGLNKYYETHNSPLKGKQTPSELVEKQKTGRLKYYEDNNVWNKGKKHSKTTRKKISESMKRWWEDRKKREI